MVAHEPQQVKAAADHACMRSSETLCDVSCHANLPHIIVCPGTIVWCPSWMAAHSDIASVHAAEMLVKRVLKRKQSGSW